MVRFPFLIGYTPDERTDYFKLKSKSITSVKQAGKKHLKLHLKLTVAIALYQTKSLVKHLCY